MRELVGLGRELSEHVGLARRLDLRVAEEGAQLRHLVHGSGDGGEVVRDRIDATGFLRGLEERAGVHALRDCH